MNPRKCLSMSGNKRLVSLTIVVMLMCLPQAFGQKGSRNELERKKDKLVKEISSLQTELDKTNKSKTKTQSQVKALKEKIAEREKLIADYSVQINAIEKNLTVTQTARMTEEERLRDLQERYARTVLFTYKHMSATNPVVFILSAGSFNEAFQRLRYIKKYAEYRRLQSQNIRMVVAGLEKKQNLLLAEKNEKRQLLDVEWSEKKKLASKKSEQDKLIKSYSEKEKKIRRDLAAKKKQQDELTKKIEAAIRKEIAAATKKAEASGSPSKGATPVKSTSAALSLTPEAKALSNSFASNQGKFPWPVEKGHISSSFGINSHPILKGVTTKNNGVDIETVKGSSIRSVFGGKVVSVISNPVYHHAVIIRHGEYFTVYSNLSGVNVSVGETVNTKQVIGTAFTNPETNKTIVHFEVWKGTVFMNPEIWLAKK